MTGWCAFFLRAVEAQAIDNQKKATAILKLYEEKKAQVVALTHSQYAIHALDFLFQHPIFTAPHFTRHSEIPKPTAARILTVLRSEQLLQTLREGKGGRSGIYIFRELINIAEGAEIF